MVGSPETKADERANLQLKAAELIFSSYSKPAAQHRLELLNSLFRETLGPLFDVRNFKKDLFPGTRVHDMSSTLFQ
jgi:hypothetical protein